MIRFIIIALVLILNILPNAQAQGPHTQVTSSMTDDRYASLTWYLLELKQAQLASKELQRLRGITPSWQPSPDLLFVLASQLWTQDNRELAIRLQQEALLHSQQATIERDKGRKQLALWLLQVGQWDAAQAELTRLIAFSQGPKLQQEGLLLACLTHILSVNGHEAQQCLHTTGLWYDLDEASQQEAVKLLKQLSRIRHWLPVAKATASAILPGAGQAMSGEVLEGSAALVLNAAWISGAISFAGQGLYLEAMLLTTGFGLRYYPTNIKNAYKHAVTHQQSVKTEAAAKLYDLVIKAYSLELSST